jgi:hypothetical protein
MTAQSSSITNNAANWTVNRSSIEAMLEVQLRYDELAQAKCIEQVFRLELANLGGTNSISRYIIRKDVCGLLGCVGSVMYNPSREMLRVVCDDIRHEISKQRMVDEFLFKCRYEEITREMSDRCFGLYVVTLARYRSEMYDLLAETLTERPSEDELIKKEVQIVTDWAKSLLYPQ